MFFILLETDRLPVVDTASQNENHGDGNGSWATTALHVLLPLAALTLLWGHQGFITRFFLQFKHNCYSELCPPLHKNPFLLKWIDKRLKYIWLPQQSVLGKKITEYWKNGSLLCSLIDSAIPGACSNPEKHWNMPPSHGQELAHKYLEILPIFTEEDLQNEYLPINKAKQFLDYLLDIQRITDKISQRKIKFTSKYVARGMGLITGEQYQKSTFYIYNNYSIVGNKSDIVISISGPFGTHCSKTIPSIHIKKRNELQKLSYVSRAQQMFFRSFSIDLGSATINPKTLSADDIPIEISKEKDRVKIVFIPKMVGMHEISIVSNGYHLVGSPFLANIDPPSLRSNRMVNNISNNEKSKSIKKKIISQFIDCIDEQIVLYSVPKEGINNKTTADQIVEPHLQCSSHESSLDLKQTNNTNISTVNTDNNRVKIDIVSKVNDTDSHNPDVSINSVVKSITDFKLSELSEVEKKSSETDEVAENTKSVQTSPICNEHIVHEVDRALTKSPLTLPYNTKKQNIKRQFSIDVEDTNIEIFNDLDDEDIDNQFEKLLESEHYYDKTDIYTDSYLTELEIQTNVFSKSSNCLFTNENNLEGVKSSTCYLKLNKPLLKTRRSLPNILETSDNHQLLSLSHKAVFKERQDYWKQRSSHSLSCSSISSEKNCLFNRHNILKCHNKNSGSLPNLCELRKAILNESNSRCDLYLDFYNSCEDDSFQEKFEQCRNFWETLSCQNLHNSVDLNSENDFDSGYYASLPNLSPDVYDDVKVTNKQFKEKKQFWENIGIENSKWVQNQQKTKKLYKKSAPNEKICVSKLLTNCNDTICEQEEDEDEDIVTKKEEVNLTDDLKEENYIQFLAAKNFFKNLEKKQLV